MGIEFTFQDIASPITKYDMITEIFCMCVLNSEQ